MTDKNKRKFLIMSSHLGLIAFSGCSTAPPKPNTYSEEISAVYKTEDAKRLVIIGVDHHYILDVPRVVSQTISSDFQPYVVATFSDFDVTTSNDIRGRYYFELKDDTPEALKRQAIDAGFIIEAKNSIIATGVVTGKRYAAPVDLELSQSNSLNQSYTININDKSLSNIKPPPSPLRKTAEGLLIIGLTPLILVTTIILWVSCDFRKCRK